jgi:hypothetical protein
VTTAKVQAETTAAVPARDGANEIWGNFPAPAPPNQRASAIEGQITSIRWGRTVNLGNYESARLEVEAAVPTAGSPESTLEEVQRWVDEHAPMSPNEENVYIGQRNRLLNEIGELSARAEVARREWRNIEAWLSANGITLPAGHVEDLPF